MKKTILIILSISLFLMSTTILLAASAGRYHGGSYDGYDFAVSNKQIISGIRTVPDESGYSLVSNYPNPFNPSTRIVYWIYRTSPVTAKVFDVAGKEVQILVEEVQTPGEHRVDFHAGNLAGGVYFYQIQVGDEDIRRGKMLLIK
jgi:hypothetical protein